MGVGPTFYVLLDWYLQTLKMKVVLAIIQYTTYGASSVSHRKSAKSSIWSCPVITTLKYGDHHMHSFSIYTQKSYWRDLVQLPYKRQRKKGIFSQQKYRNCYPKSYAVNIYIYWKDLLKKWGDKIPHLTKGGNCNKWQVTRGKSVIYVSDISHPYLTICPGNYITGCAVWERENWKRSTENFYVACKIV